MRVEFRGKYVKILERWIPKNIENIVLEYVKSQAYPLGFTKQEKLVLGKFAKYRVQRTKGFSFLHRQTKGWLDFKAISYKGRREIKCF